MQHLADALNAALAHHHAGRHHDAEILFRQVLDEKPDIPDAWLLLGLTLSAQNKLDDAIAAYRRAIGYAPQSAAARVNLAEALMQTGNVSRSTTATPVFTGSF